MLYRYLQRCVQKYNSFVLKRPFLSNCATYGGLACAAEGTQQIIERKFFKDLKEEVIKSQFHSKLYQILTNFLRPLIGLLLDGMDFLQLQLYPQVQS